MLTLENEAIRVEVAPEHGAEIRYIAAGGQRNVLAFYDWDAPIPADRSVSYGSSVLDWCSQYRGGWQELFPNAGPDCVLDDLPLPFHGEVSVSQWDVVAADATSATLRVGARLPLVLERRMSLAPAEPVLRLEETVINCGNSPTPFLWAHHPAFEVVPGLRIDLPPGPIHLSTAPDAVAGEWPTLADGGEDLSIAGKPPVERLTFLPKRPGWAALRDPDSSIGVALAWDATVFPHIWLWQQMAGSGFPWYGRAHVVGIEPHSAWPMLGLAELAKRGDAHTLPPAGSLTSWLTIALFAADTRPVTGVTREGKVERVMAVDTSR